MPREMPKAASQPEVRVALIAKGHSQAAKFSWRKMAEQVAEVLAKSMGS